LRPELTSADGLRVMTDAADKIAAANAHYDASGHSNSHAFGRINIGRIVRGL